MYVIYLILKSKSYILVLKLDEYNLNTDILFGPRRSGINAVYNQIMIKLMVSAACRERG